MEGDAETHGQLAAALAAAPVWLAGRERTKTNNIRLMNEMRVATTRARRRMVERGVYDTPTSGSMLSNEELDAFLEDPAPWVEVIRERRAAVPAALRPRAAVRLRGRGAASAGLVDAGRRPGARRVRRPCCEGIPGCPGSATGRARVVLDPDDPGALEPGDILIAPMTDPSWTPLFVPAAAVVVDVGAQLSHAVIVSRELGIPCVISVTDGTRRIPDGATVTVDGTAGTVTVH